MLQEYTAISIPVPNASFIQTFRTQHISSPAVTKPPHITIHSPFKSVEDINQSILDELKDLINSYSKFEFVLQKIGRFPDIGVLYLIPEPVIPFRTLSQAIKEKFLDPPPYFEDPVMHPTIAREESKILDTIEEEFNQKYQDQLPFQTMASEVNLYQKRDGVWRIHSTFALSPK